MDITVVIFLLGYLPGFGVDRTGAAVVGGLAMIGFGRISAEAAWAAIDYQTLGLLFGLVIVSGAYTVSGFYPGVAARVALLNASPRALLAILIATGGMILPRKSGRGQAAMRSMSAGDLQPIAECRRSAAACPPSSRPASVCAHHVRPRTQMSPIKISSAKVAVHG